MRQGQKTFTMQARRAISAISLYTILPITNPDPPALPEADTCDGRGTVYVAYTVDTESRPLPQSPYSADLNLIDFKPGQLVDWIMSDQGRGSYKDSYGKLPVYTWMLLSDEYFCASTSGDCAAVHSAMEPFTDKARAWGDLFGWHFHSMDWCDLDGDGISYWNQLTTFNGTVYNSHSDIELAEKSLAYLVLEQQFYPSVFRSGWVWENNDFSVWLDDILPFDFSNLSPLLGLPRTPDGIGNVYDWTRAPGSWLYYHPSSIDYQSPGELKRYIFRTSNAYEDFEKAFVAADEGTDQLIITYTHTYNHGLGLEYSSTLAHFRTRYPCVPVKFVNALDGAREILQLRDTIPPGVFVSRFGNLMQVQSDRPLFTFPYAAIKTGDGSYTRVRPVDTEPQLKAGSYEWVYDISTLKSDQFPIVFAAAGTTASGNTFVSPQFFITDAGLVTSTDDENDFVPTSFELAQNYPNPFNSSTTIVFSLPATAHVTLRIYNALGQLVQTLADGELDSGDHLMMWNGTDTDDQPVASGVYIYRLTAGEYGESRQMVLLK